MPSEPVGTTNTAFHRPAMVQALRTAVANDEPFDAVVIGGGITGAGVALDAATRGHRVLLLDRDDLASGTSSKSSKLIHGGLRYLQQGDVELVREALRERHLLTKNAPHLVTTLPFLLPIFTKDGLFPRRIARALGSALWAYDTAGGWRIGRLHRRIRRGKVADLCPGLPSDRVAGGYLYFDARADDARLTLDVARTAAHHDAIVVNHCPVRSIMTANGDVASVVVDLDGESLTIPTRTVINAAGVWAQAIDELVDAPLNEPLPPIAIRPARGVHVSIPWELVRNTVAVVLPVPGDRRSVFLIPSGPRADGTFDVAHIGTTDTDHKGGFDDPQCTDADVEYLLRAVNHSLGHRIDPSQVLGVWAGLRPLVVPTDASTERGGGSRTADLSRRHRVDVSTSGVIRVIGGKLTTYRQMAQDTVDELDRIVGKRRPCTTARTRIVGRDEADIASIVAEQPERAKPVAPGVQLTHADVIASVRFELATNLIDVLTRRTRLHIDDRSRAMEIAPAVAMMMANELGWDDERRTTEINAYLALCEAERRATAEVA